MIQDLVKKDIGKIKTGKRLFNRIKARINGDVLLFPHKSLGDIYILGIFLAQGWNNAGKQYGLVVVGNKCADMALQVGFKNVLYIDEQKMNCILRYITFYEDKITSAKVLHFYYTYTNLGMEIAYYKKLNFVQCYSKLVFEYDLNINGRIPKLGAIEEKDVKQTGINEEAIVISPYAKSISNLSWLYWMNLVSYLNEHGYKKIYTNCARNENELPGTKRLDVELNKICKCLDYACCFIGIRSGLCDIISSSKCKKVVLYPKESYFKDTAMFYSLKCLPGAINYFEIEVPNDSVSYGFERIIEYMKGMSNGD